MAAGWSSSSSISNFAETSEAASSYAMTLITGERLRAPDYGRSGLTRLSAKALVSLGVGVNACEGNLPAPARIRGTNRVVRIVEPSSRSSSAVASARGEM